MLAEFLLAAAFQVGPFYQQGPDYVAARPFYAQEGGDTDVLWPVFTSHTAADRDWWRFLLFMHYQQEGADAYQFEIMPLWFNGRTRDGESYGGLFPIYGRHPHFMMVYDWEFALWPVWMRYRMPRAVYSDADGAKVREQTWMTSNVVLFPFFSWRDDGSWGAWPLCGVNHQRESDHRYALWPFVTWAAYRADRDTAGAGSSWMLWPLYGRIRRERERQDLVLPPFFSVTTTFGRPRGGEEPHSGPSAIRIRAPWPLVDYESSPARERLSLWPLYERDATVDYVTGEESAVVTRFGWKLIELYDDETRVFPFWTSRKDDSYFRLWPLYESWTGDGETRVSRVLALFPIRWVPAVDRSWAKFWTFYERTDRSVAVDHSLLWGLIRWRNWK